MADTSFNIACKELKITQIAQLNQLFQLLHLVHELTRMLMRKNVNNDVPKIRLYRKYERGLELTETEVNIDSRALAVLSFGDSFTNFLTIFSALQPLN